MPQPPTLSDHRMWVPAAFVFLWSTGFIGARLGLPYAEAMTFLSVRFVIVIALLALAVMIWRRPRPRGVAIGHLLVSGVLVHGIYLGGVFSAIEGGASPAISALIVGLQPLLTAVIAVWWLGETMVGRQWLGVLLGLAAVALVVIEQLVAGGDADGLAVLQLFAALAGITLGTLYQKRFVGKMDLISGSLVQYLGALAFCAVFAFTLEERTIDWTPSFVFALGWLCIVLSLGAITLLMVLIERGAASQVASLFYLVPPVVAVEAWLLFNDRLSPWALLGLALASLAVWLVRRPPLKNTQP